MFQATFSQLLSRGRAHVVLIVLILTTLAHTINMFGFPAYREDEGTYMSQSWAVLNQGKLAAYTYWYDHAPVGWIFMAAWNALTGGFDIAGISVNAGRVFMAVLQIISTYLLYRIAFNITKRKDASVIAALLFSLTPLAIMSHRRVLLDNIMVFWFLISLLYLTKEIRLRNIMISAVAFALAALTKESAVSFLPVMIAIVSYNAHQNNKHFAIVLWISLVGLIGSVYFVFALLKGELFPTGTLLGGTNPHVSLIDALKFHSTRDGGFFLADNSSFRYSLENSWLAYSPIFIVLGLIATALHLVNYRRKWHFLIALLSVAQFIFIIRGLVLDWYIIPILPLFALSISLLYSDLMARFTLNPYRYRQAQIVAVSFLVIAGVYQFAAKFYIFTLNQTKNQVQAVEWVKYNIDKDDILLIDNYAFVDLNHDLTDITKTNVHYYWKADTDPQIKGDVLKNDWNTVDYLLFTPALTRSIYQDDLFLVRDAFERSYVVKRFNHYDIMNEGYPVEIREVNNRNGTLHSSWAYYKEHFITTDGQVIDPSSNNQTTSEAQSYALLRAVWENDWETFDLVFDWTMKHMKLSDAHLFAWLAQAEGGQLHIKDYTTASDADEDIALALLFAGKRWNSPYHIEEAKKIINDIWKYEVVQVDNRLYLTAGTNLMRNGGYLANPSYFSPATYRIFAQVDPDHPWNTLAADVYTTLDELADQAVTSTDPTYLVPNWFIITPDGVKQTTTAYVNPEADYYGYDAFRLYWRIALDSIWFESPEAKEYLSGVSPFFKKEWENNKKIHAVYALDGTPIVNYSDISTDVGALSTFFITEPELAIDVFSENFWPQYKNGYWGDKTKYYNQNWAWFATALYAYNLPNLWNDADAIARK